MRSIGHGLALVICVLGVAGGLRADADQGDRTPASQPSVGPADDSRWEELLERRRERLRNVVPARPNAVVDFLSTVENEGFDQFISLQVSDFRVGFGKLSPLSSFTPAVRYERPRLGGTDLSLRVSGAYSVRSYQAYALQFGFFDTLAPRDFLGSGFLGAPFVFDYRTQEPLERFLYLDVGYLSFPREYFYGLGMESSQADRSDYLLEEGGLDAVAGYQFSRWLALQARVGYPTTNVSQGNDDRHSDTSDLFGEQSVPGVDQQTNFLRLDTGLYLGFERDPNLPSALLGLRWARFDDHDGDHFQFNRFSIDARGYLPILSRQRVLAVRLYASRDQADSGATVPFYLMKTLGGANTLRGYSESRFRDENLLHLSAEYRWEANPAVELAIFYDMGKVFDDSSDFDFEGTKHSWGAGVRFKSMRRVVFRIDIGHGDEGTRVAFDLGPSF
jgi:hypothetical protein